MSEILLKTDGLSRTYSHNGGELQVLVDVTFEISRGEALAVVGPSGSGKTTLLGLCAGLDKPTAGEVYLCGHSIDDLSEDQRAQVRNDHVGFVFQSFHLIPTLTAVENVMVPLELRKDDRGAESRAKELLSRVGLGDRINHYPAQLSGGEQQRVALARAFVNQPDVLFADEPTGNLDNTTGTLVEDLLFELNKDYNTTLVLVTHDLELANRCGRILKMTGGRIDSETVGSGAHTCD